MERHVSVDVVTRLTSPSRPAYAFGELTRHSWKPAAVSEDEIAHPLVAEGVLYKWCGHTLLAREILLQASDHQAVGRESHHVIVNTCRETWRMRYMHGCLGVSGHNLPYLSCRTCSASARDRTLFSIGFPQISRRLHHSRSR